MAVILLSMFWFGRVGLIDQEVLACTRSIPSIHPPEE